MTIRYLLLCSGVCTAGALSGTSWGQAADSRTAASAPNDELAEITITAERRSESLQHAPISVQAVTGQQIVAAGISQAQDLTRLVPSVQITASAAPDTLINLRGVSNLSVNPFGEAAVAFNYDGVYIARPSSIGGVFYDLARVEVVNGPQGILYGRNATGGALNVVPETPKIGELSGNALLEYGSYALRHVAGALNLPVSDTFALRGAFNIIDRNGYMSDGTSDDVGQAGRLMARWEPLSNLSVVVGGDYYHQGGQGIGATIIGANAQPATNGNYYIGAQDPRSCPALGAYFTTFGPGAPAFACSVVQQRSSQDNVFYGLNATIDWTTDFGTLTVIPAHRYSQIDADLHDVRLIQQADVDKEDTLEARFRSNADGPLRYLAGAYYLNERDNGIYNVNLIIPGVLNEMLHLKTQSWATFGQLTYLPVEQLRVSVGARFTHEEKDSDNSVQTLSFVPGGAPQVINGSPTFNHVDWRVGADYDLTANSLIYASIGTGFRSGGFFFVPSGFNDSYQPEYITAYTVGIKNTFLDNKLVANLEVFDYKYRDQQISHPQVIIAPGLPPLSLFPTENIGDATMYGTEFDTHYRLTSTTTLGATVQYLHARYTRFEFNQPISTPTGCLQQPTGGGQANIDCVGFAPPQAPDWTAALNAEQKIPLPGGKSIVLAADAHYQSKLYTSVDYIPAELVGNAWTEDVSLSYRAARVWAVTGYVNNVSDKAVISFSNGPGTPGSATWAIVAPPREYGIRLTADF